MSEQKINYQRRLDEIIKGLDPEKPPKLLLHACCAPCSSYSLEYLTEHFSVTVYYYNPNIFPKEEFQRRTEELKRLISLLPVRNPVTLIVGDYDPEEFFRAVKGLEQIPEGGKRCEACFRLRLESAARLARELGADWFTTTLTISPMKDAGLLNRIAEELGERYGVRALPTDLKKKNGYKRSVELSAIYGLYRQDYCGCIFSKREREKQKAEKIQENSGRK